MEFNGELEALATSTKWVDGMNGHREEEMKWK